MRATIIALASLVVSTTAFTGFLAPMRPAVPVSRASASSLRMQGDVVDTIAGLQGPVVYWGAAGVPLGHEESDIRGYDNFGLFAQALQSSGVANELRQGGPWTIFAPTDKAMSVYKGPLDATLIKNHVVQGHLPLSAITGDVQTLSSTLTYGRRFRKTFLDEAMVGIVSAGASKGQTYPVDVPASNGLIHAIDVVLELQ